MFLFDLFYRPREEIQKYFRSFLVQMKTKKIASEIYWPLVYHNLVRLFDTLSQYYVTVSHHCHIRISSLWHCFTNSQIQSFQNFTNFSFQTINFFMNGCYKKNQNKIFVIFGDWWIRETMSWTTHLYRFTYFLIPAHKNHSSECIFS